MALMSQVATSAARSAVSCITRQAASSSSCLAEMACSFAPPPLPVTRDEACLTSFA